jgi:hypothetical protein
VKKAALLLLLLTSCGSESTHNAVAAAEEDDRIECRIGNAATFERFCAIERSESEQGLVLTVRKPDGGFRRLLVAEDGRGVVAADGAERTEVTVIAGDRIEVAIGGDTFRLPATIRR